MRYNRDGTKTISFEEFERERRRGGPGGGPGDDGPDLFRVFRDVALKLRNDAKGILRPMLPSVHDQAGTPELQTFNRIAAGGVGGTLAAIQVLLAHRLQSQPR